MPAFTAKRTSDNLLYVPDLSAALPADGGTAVLANAVRALGGVAGDYEFLELTDVQYAAMVGQTGRAYLSGEAIQIKAMTLTSSAPTLVSDGSATVTLTADTGDAGYTGDVTFTVTAPDGSQVSETIEAVAGVAQTTLDTEQVGVHTITAACVEFGVKTITVEGT